MHPYVAALGLSTLLVLSGTALSLLGNEPPALAEEEAHDEHGAMRGHGHAGAHPWSGGTGTIPDAKTVNGLDRRSNIIIESDEGFNPANGVRSGHGTFDDPYVISGYYIDTIYIHDTTAAFEIKENYVTDILILDWTGQGGYVHHNHINNLRTNRNVERVGDPSASVIENNKIVEVEELRHFDGVVANNTIGQPSTLQSLLGIGPAVAFNIAGLNSAGIHDNTIFGGVDMKIHGHHHSDATGAHSHNHGRPDEAQDEGHVEDHQTRYVDFLFYNNTIKDSGFGLRYNDLNHAGDDRTATSEQEPDLEKMHVHHTRVAIVNNVIDGARLEVAILNAPDERHLAGESAELVIMKNRVLKPQAGDGLFVHDVRNAHVYVQENRVEKGEGLLDDVLARGPASAIYLASFANSTVHVADNWLGAYTYGVRASAFDKNTTWSVDANDAAGAEYPVYWDESVANEPEGHSGGEEHAHDDGGHEGDAAAPVLLRRIGLGL